MTANPTPPPSTTAVPNSITYRATSLSDDGTAKRPRDARLIHLFLTSQGLEAYQERVPLQLLDFAYRYTSSVLSDALHLTSEGYVTNQLNKEQVPQQSTSSSSAGHNLTLNKINATDLSTVSLQALRLAVGSRTQYQFQSSLPKEYLLELAQERNRVMLPRLDGKVGTNLPPERYCLTGVTWNIKEEWEDGVGSDSNMEDVKSEKAEENGDDDETMEDVFGGRSSDEDGEGDVDRVMSS